MSQRDEVLADGACAALEIAAKRRGLLGLEQAYNRLSERQRALVPARFLDELRTECGTSSEPQSSQRREAETPTREEGVVTSPVATQQESNT